MGKYDGFLICSDFDGTMAYQAKVSRENCEAIAYFQSEGGIFCPCSGRDTLFFHRYTDQFRANGPVITLNGSVISEYADDPADDRILYLGKTPRELTLEYVRDALTLEGVKRVGVYRLGEGGVLTADGEAVPENIRDDLITLDDIKEDVQKIIIVHDIVHLDGIRAYVEPKYGDRLIFGSSWSSGFEAQLIGTDKGSSALRVKEMVGAHTLVCVGDYENDVPMLRVADISYAVGNALDCVKAAAQRVTVPCTEHAIAKIISELL